MSSCFLVYTMLLYTTTPKETVNCQRKTISHYANNIIKQEYAN